MEAKVSPQSERKLEVLLQVFCSGLYVEDCNEFRQIEVKGRYNDLRDMPWSEICDTLTGNAIPTGPCEKDEGNYHLCLGVHISTEYGTTELDTEEFKLTAHKAIVQSFEWGGLIGTAIRSMLRTARANLEKTEEGDDG